MDYLPLLLIAGVIGAIVNALFFEGRRKRRASPPEPPRMPPKPESLGLLHDAITRLQALPREGAEPAQVAEIMENVPTPDRTANEIYEALRKNYKGSVPTLQALIWMAEQPWYEGSEFQPGLHRSVISSILLKGQAVASRAYLDQIANRAFDIPKLLLEPNPVLVIGHGAKRMADIGETELAERLSANQAELLDRREAALESWLEAELAALDQADRSDPWQTRAAFRASWPLSAHIQGAPKAAAALLAAAQDPDADPFRRSVLTAALGALVGKGCDLDMAAVQKLVEAALSDPDLRLAEAGIDAALELLDQAPRQTDAAALARAFETCLAQGGDAIEEAAELRDVLEDVLNR